MTYALGAALVAAIAAAIRYRLALAAAEGATGAERVLRQRAEDEAALLRTSNVALREAQARLQRSHDTLSARLADAEARAAQAIQPGEGAQALRDAFR